MFFYSRSHSGPASVIMTAAPYFNSNHVHAQETCSNDAANAFKLRLRMFVLSCLSDRPNAIELMMRRAVTADIAETVQQIVRQ